MRPDPRPPRRPIQTQFVRGEDGRTYLAVDRRAEPTPPHQTVQFGILQQRITTSTNMLLQRVRVFAFRLEKLPVRQLLSRLAGLPKFVYAGEVIAVLVAGFLLLHHSAPTENSTSNIKTTTQIKQEVPTPATPKFETLLPAGKTIASLGGWYRLGPSTSQPAYAFVDNIGSVQIDVSEQLLPDSFKDNTAEAVNQFAQSNNATQKLTAAGTTVYIGTSAKGPQSIILTKNNLLILIKSAEKLTNDQWIAYINTLQ